MSKAEWKDISSYSRYDKDRTPHTWELRIGTVKLCVTRHVDCNPDEWMVQCSQTTFNMRVLKAKDTEDAKTEALALLHREIREVFRKLEAMV